MTRRSSRSSGRTCVTPGLSRHDPRHGPALTFEDSLLHVAEVFAVHLKRQRARRAYLDPVDVVPVEHSLFFTAECRSCGQPRYRARANPKGSHEIETAFETRLGSEPERQSRQIRVRVAVRNHHERRLLAVDLHRGVQTAAAREQAARHGGRERAIRRAPPVPASELVDTADYLRRETEPGGDAETPAVHPADADP